MAMYAYQCIVLAVLHIVAVESENPVLVVNGLSGETASFECAFSSIISTSSCEIRKDGDLVYDCVGVGFACSKLSADPDYSDVTFSGIGTSSGKGTFTVDNANVARDGGSWTCRCDSSDLSNSFTFLVTSTSTSTSTTVTPTATTTNLTTSTPTNKATPLSVFAETSPTTYTITSPTGLNKTTTNTEKQTIGLIAGGVGIVVVICCGMCICAIMRRRVNAKKRMRRQERREEVEANVHISESL